MLRRWIIPCGFFVALFAFIAVFSSVTLPKRTSYGANWGPFLKEAKNSIDVMFFGSSVVYCNVLPTVINEKTGYSAYVLAGPEQTVSTMYYYVKEAYNTQNPSIVFIEVTGMFYPRYTNFAKANIGYMPWSINRILATFNTTEREEWIGLLFPPYNYHDRWFSLTLEDFAGYEVDEYRGYTYLDTAKSVEAITTRTVNYDEALYKENLSYLERIVKYCVKKGSKPVIFISPSYGRWEENYLKLLKNDISNITDAEFIDLNESFDKLGIDNSTDFFDFLHFNYNGAKKFSSYLSDIILSY